VLDDLGVVARRVAVWETDEACAIATRSGDGGESLVAVATAVTVDDRP
jgi:hypothetical protein